MDKDRKCHDDPDSLLKQLANLKRKLANEENDLCDASLPIERAWIKETVQELKEEIAWLLLDIGQFEEAISIYQAMPWKGNGMTKYSGIGRALTEMKRFAEAELILRKGFKLFPESVCLLNTIGNLYRKTERHLEAVKYYDMALRIDPDNPGINYNKAAEFYAMGCLEETHAIAKKFAKRPKYNAIFMKMTGYCLINMGYPEQAIPYFADVCQRGDVDSDGINGLFWAYFECGMIGEAAEIARDGIRRFPTDDSVLYDDLATAYLEREWFNEARETVNEGLKVFPDDEDLKEMLEIIDEAENDPHDDKKEPLKAMLGLLLIKEMLKRQKR